MNYNLDEKVILITGASGGIGFACAKMLYEKGAKLVLTDLSIENLKNQVKESNFDSTRILLLELNVTNTEQSKQVVEKTVAHFGKLDIVFANAGIAASPLSTVFKMPETEFERVVEVDLLGVYRTIKAALPEIVKNKGQILITASAYSFFNGVFNAPYAVSKAGIEMLGRALRAELAYTGATATVLYPGWVNTKIAQVVFGESETATQLAKIVLPNYLLNPIEPEIVAKAVVKGLQNRSSRIFSPKKWGFLWSIQSTLAKIGDVQLGENKKIRDLLQKSDEA